MDLYDKDISVMRSKVDEICAVKIDKNLLRLSDYCNETEKQTIVDILSQYKTTSREELLERLHNILEVEIIFDSIWSIDEYACIQKIFNFDTTSVYGSSFIAEFVKRIKCIGLPITNIKNSVEFRNLYGVMSVKFFKSKEHASKYFDTFMNNVKNVPGVNIQETSQQLDKFLDIFQN